MADVTTTKRSLQITATYSDGGSKLLVVDNAKDTLTASDIADLESFLVANHIFLGDGDASIVAISDARTITNENTKLDLS
ncbi:MAG: DUF2922 family protein [Selenomonadaceae bacterium]|nr:DUF2922 family protein [Selenomonadaceae bacterium]